MCRVGPPDMQRVGKGSGWNWGLLGHVSGILVGCMHWMAHCNSICCCPPLPIYTQKVRTRKMAKHERKQLRPANEGCFGVSGGSTWLGTRPVGREIPCGSSAERRWLRGEVCAREEGQ